VQSVSVGLRAADLVVAPSFAMLAALECHYGPLPQTRVVPNGRHMQPVPHAGKEPFVFTAGRLWDAAKNVEAVFDVASSLPWPVFVAGAPGPASTASQAIHLGRLEGGEVARWMARASIYVLPARYEPFGLSVLEAALSGCALVLGDIDSLREIWDDVAVFVPPGDRTMLAAAILRLIDNEGLRERLARRAHQRASRFTDRRMVATYLSLYRSLIRSRVVAPGRTTRTAHATLAVATAVAAHGSLMTEGRPAGNPSHLPIVPPR
jgi:glycosyltransferase involved in cell wall biosynthesis